MSPPSRDPDARRPASAAVEQKAARYLAEGRVTVRSRAGQVVEATCVGRDDYALGHDPEAGWFCSCPARGLCAHLIALQLVTTGRTGREAP